METKGFEGHPFGIQSTRFDVSAIYPDVKRPSTYLQAPYSKVVLSDLYRKLGPGTYSLDYGSFSAIALQKRLSTSSWAKAQESTRLSQMPHFNFKDICKKKKTLKENLGPGTYEYKSFLELQERHPRSTKGIIDTGEVRFKDRIRECYPGPGTYGNPYALQEKRCVTALGIMDSKTAKCFNFPNMGSGLGPGTYNMKDSMNEMLKRVVSTRGPYETFTGDRTKPMISGHYAVDKKSTELGSSNIKSFLDELETKDKKRHGVFSTLPRNPGCPTERIFWTTVGQCPHENFRAAPGSYNIKPIQRKEYENQPPFWIGAKRFDRKANQLFFGSSNPVGVGRYDTTKHEKYPKKIRYGSLYMSETQRYLSNLERDKCLQERITPVNKGHWDNPATA
ncbi:ciliary microtubule-associated protein 2 [Tiliqua scincoides]|uniref:ciliary microtubule-associated protein 2 n=1 Tax=Tiliqua scincoides TaxID=71010 RepID=UPI003462CCCD